MDDDIVNPRGIHALDVSIVFTTLATVIVLIRFYTRLWMVRQFGADDLAILNALLFTWGFFVLFYYEVKFGMGQHMNDLPADIVTKQLIALWASVPIYQMTLFSSKASILLQYRRVFKIQKMLLACNIMLGVIVVYGTWTFVSAWLNCIPVAKFWDDSIPGYCLNKEGLWFSNSAMHILSDIIILTLPMPVLKSLQLPTKQKVALMGVFALGGFVTVTTIIRLKSLLVISKSSDPTYDNVGAATWSAIECNVAIICASLPTIKPLISKLFPKILSSAGHYSHSYSYSRNNNNRTGGGLSKGSRAINNNLSTVNATVVGADDSLAMYDMHRHHRHGGGSSSGHDSSASSQENLSQDGGKMGGIKVTTVLSQESVTRDETSSVRQLVNKPYLYHDTIRNDNHGLYSTPRTNSDTLTGASPTYPTIFDSLPSRSAYPAFIYLSAMSGIPDLPEKYEDLPDRRRFWPAPAGSEEEGLGMLRLLTPDVVAAAARSEIQTGERVCLNWDLEKLDPPGFGRKPFEHRIKWVDPDNAFDDEFHFNPQQSSQWDGLRHHSAPGPDGKTKVWYGGTTAEEILDPNSTRIGMGFWAKKGIAGRGVLIDYLSWAEKRGIEVNALTQHVVSLDDVLEIARECGIEFRRGDIFFLRVGLTKTWDKMTPAEKQAYSAQKVPKHAGIEQSERVVKFFWDNHFAAVASDTVSFEVFPPLQKEWDLHHHLLAGWGLPIGEMFDLEGLAELCKKHKRWTFFVSSSPLNCAKGVASPPNCMAIF